MITPPYLNNGDIVALIAPARKVVPEEMAHGVNVLKSWGLEISEGKNLYKEWNQFSGTDEERIQDFQEALDDPQIKAVFSARGGYGNLRIIDKIDFTKFNSSPKWLVGYSDFTVVHSHVNRNSGVESIHGDMPFKFKNQVAVETLRKILTGEKPEYSQPHKDHISLIKKGKVSGELIGGNLSLLYALNGSRSEYNYEGKILFIEDLDEYLYQVDRMLLCLKRAGKLEKLRGLIVGGMTEMRDNQVPFGKTAEEIISEVVAEYDFPVTYGFTSGHIDENKALIFGRKIVLEVNSETARVEFH